MVQQYEMRISPKSAVILSSHTAVNDQYPQDEVTMNMVFHITHGPVRSSLMVVLKVPAADAVHPAGVCVVKIRYILAADHCCEKAITRMDSHLYTGSSSTGLCRILRSRGIRDFSTACISASIATVTHTAISAKSKWFVAMTPINMVWEVPMTAEQFSAFRRCITSRLALGDIEDE